MKLAKENLRYYYPGYQVVYAWRNQICFCFIDEHRIEIYSKSDFQLLFQSNAEAVYNLFMRFPFLAGLKIDGDRIHIFKADKVNRNQYLAYFECHDAFTYDYTIEQSGIYRDKDLIDAHYVAEEVQDYEALFQKLDMSFLGNDKKLGSLFQKNQNRLYGDLQSAKEGCELKNEIFKGSYKNLVIKEHYFEKIEGKKIYYRRILAIDALANKVKWFFDLENDISKNDYSLLIQLKTFNDKRIPKDSTDSFYPRIYGDVPFVANEAYIFRHNECLYALDVMTGKLLWKKANSFDFPLVYKQEAYILNVMESFKKIDLSTGEVLYQNDHWIEDKSSWYQMADYASNLWNQTEQTKIYNDYIVAYNFWTGIFCFFSRTDGSLILELDVKEIFFDYALENRKIKRRNHEYYLEQDQVYYPTPFWEMHNHRLFIQLSHVFCVFDLAFDSKNPMHCRLGTYREVKAEKKKKAKETRNRNNEANNTGKQLTFDF
jgi:hypothetical protein